MILSETRRALRRLRHAGGFSVAVITISALAMSAGGVVVAVLDATVFHPTELPAADELFLVGTEMPEAGLGPGFFERLSGPEALEIVRGVPSLKDPLVFDLNSVALRTDGAPQRLFAGFAAADPLKTLSISPAIGRSFTSRELSLATPVTLISWQAWRSLLGADPDIVGQAVIIDGVPHTVIGIAPREAALYGVELWLPLPGPLDDLDRSRRNLNLLGRRASTSGQSAVEAQLGEVGRATAASQESEHPEYRNWRLLTRPWNRQVAAADTSDAMVILGALLIALTLGNVNLAGLVAARQASRRGELALRRALGAGPWEIRRPLFLETTVLLVVGTALSCFGTSFLLASASSWLPTSWLPSRPLTFGAESLAIQILLAGLSWTMIVLASFGSFGSLGSLSGSDEMGSALNGARIASPPAASRQQRVTVWLQLGAAQVLLACAGALTIAVLQDAWRPPGWTADDIVSMRISRTGATNESPASFFERLTQEVGAWPDVERATVATQVLPNTLFGAEIELLGGSSDGGGELRRVFHTVVGDDYFATLGIHLVAGRALDSTDRSNGPCAAVINEVAAARLFGRQSALGNLLRVHGSSFDSGACEVVGVSTAVAHRGPAEPIEPEVFTSHRQAGDRYRQMFLIARTTLDQPTRLVPRVRSALARIDPDQPLYAASSGREALDELLAARRALALLFAALATAGLAMTASGLSGLAQISVLRRSRELAIRLCFGATQSEVRSLAIRRCLRMMAPGQLGGLSALVILISLPTAPAALAPLDWTWAFLATGATIALAWLAAFAAARGVVRTSLATLLRRD